MKLLGGLTALCSGIKPSFLVWGMALLSVIVLSALLVPGALALPVPEVQIIPEMLSENGSFLMIVDPMVYDQSIRATWSVPGFIDTNIGLLPRDGNKWVCYFSNDDAEATCGPTPFFSNFETYSMLVKTVNGGGDSGNKSMDIEVGAIKLKPQLSVQGANVNMLIFPSGGIPKEVSYAVYDSNFAEKVGYTLLSMDPATGYFRGRVTINTPGTYYFAFKTDDQSDAFGGGLIKKGIGTGTGGLIFGEVEADAIVLNLLLNKTQVYRNINNVITNIGDNNLTGLDVSVDSAIEGVVSVELEKRTLYAGDSSYFTVKLENVQNRMDIVTYANVTSNGSVVGQIFLALNVSVLNECADDTHCPICPVLGGDFYITPTIWKDDFLVGASPEQSFDIINSGDSDLTFEPASTGDLGQNAEITAPPVVSPGATEQMTIKLTPTMAGAYAGVITITTSAGSQNVVVQTNFYNDVSDSITDAKTELELLAGSGIDQAVLDDIDYELTQAEDDAVFGYYKEAAEGYEEAMTKIYVLEDMIAAGYTPPVNGGNGGSSGGDSSALIIILFIALAALGGILFYLKKIKRPGGDDESVEDELGMEEEGY